METRETIIRKIEKLADFQMRKSTHIRFLENCTSESVSPNGLKLELQVQVGENSRLQKIVDGILKKTSLEITRVVSEEHYLQLQESKPKMAELEDKLRKTVKDEGEFNTITHSIFNKTETKKNKIIDKQAKKLSKLTDSRDCYIDHISQTDHAQSDKASANKTNARMNTKGGNKPSGNTVKLGKKKQKQRPSKPVPEKTQIKPVNKINPKQSPSAETKTTNDSKNEVAPNSNKKSYSTAVKMGQQKLNKPNGRQIQAPGTMQQQLSGAIQQLVNCLRVLNVTEDSSASPTENSGGNKRRFKKKYNGVKRQS